MDTHHSLFVSDLHLCHTRPHITQLFITFLLTTAMQAEALYILGDLFEYWAGDDDLDDPHHQPIITVLNTLAASGTRVFFMHGNRDFLLSQGFAKAAGIELLPDPTLLSLYGKSVLLSHGDFLCTDDVSYQAFRQQVRNAEWQAAFLSQPLLVRKQQIEALRLRSEQEKFSKNEAIMDVNAAALEALMASYHYPQLFIHGHTHKPALHSMTVNKQVCQRWVLADWFAQGSYLRLDADGCRAIPLALNAVN